MSATSRKSSQFTSVKATYHALQQAVILVVIYVILLFLLPSGRETIAAYHFNMLEYHIISFAIALPSLLVWLAAFVGWAALEQYARSLRGTPDAEYFERLASGCGWLAWSLPLTALVSLILSALEYQWPTFHGAAIILANYFNLIFPLVAFSIIGVASRGLVARANLKLSLAAGRAIVVVFLTAGVFYCYLTFKHFNLSSLGSTHNPYFLPIWLMVISVIIPYFYAWFAGLLASYEITLLSKQVSGTLYRRALQLLVSGLVTIIISLIAQQYISGVAPRIGHLIFDYRLVFSVLFHIIGGVGFILITFGALKLKKLEEV